ncbi:hypothetical protein SAMN05192559_10874 [Halobacillus karajensis]|uniref:DUF6282 family protein n=1 Tax=Halobacillus karajensis TaxID=195088 RepID=UPI0008A79149|nr:DUF6282 family protein [Halobacillus karajensis]SEI04422.1 hypothetical protein SAMN05192559_10874 [Halobacillus karajensis]
MNYLSEAQSLYHPLLKGAYELHVHSSPSAFPRKQTDWELVEEAKEAGMKGLVIKAHEGATYDRAALIRQQMPDMNVYGGLVCNLFTGGLSSHSVDMALRMGAKVIWMPTISAEQHAKYFAEYRQERFFNSETSLDDSSSNLTILNEKNKVKDEVKKILYLIASYDAILATGHLSPYEVDILVEEARAFGVKRILIQHADLGIAKIPMDLQEKLAGQGCYIEKCYLACGEDFNNITVPQMADSIQTLGSESCILVTDYGQPHNPPPVQGLSEFVTELINEGISEEMIREMITTNPESLLF